MVKFVFIDEKERKFKKLRMKVLSKAQEKMTESIKKAKSQDEVMLAVGTMVAELVEPFEPEEIFEAEQDEFMLAQGIHLLQPYYKGGRTKPEIDALVKDIIDAGTIANINQIKYGGGFQG
ncbi:MAG: hypothetical protein K8E24_014320 [Methanobacterium paludis]|nr:hypothetical protein [Methanobacterium paludis]